MLIPKADNFFITDPCKVRRYTSPEKIDKEYKPCAPYETSVSKKYVVRECIPKKHFSQANNCKIECYDGHVFKDTRNLLSGCRRGH